MEEKEEKYTLRVQAGTWPVPMPHAQIIVDTQTPKFIHLFRQVLLQYLIERNACWKVGLYLHRVYYTSICTRYILLSTTQLLLGIRARIACSKKLSGQISMDYTDLIFCEFFFFFCCKYWLISVISRYAEFLHILLLIICNLNVCIPTCYGYSARSDSQAIRAHNHTFSCCLALHNYVLIIISDQIHQC